MVIARYARRQALQQTLLLLREKSVPPHLTKPLVVVKNFNELTPANRTDLYAYGVRASFLTPYVAELKQNPDTASLSQIQFNNHSRPLLRIVEEPQKLSDNSYVGILDISSLEENVQKVYDMLIDRALWGGFILSSGIIVTHLLY